MIRGTKWIVMVANCLHNLKNVKIKSYSMLTLQKTFIHVAIYLIENHIEKYEKVFKKEWTNNGLLKS
jgi:hypothetical protein